MLLHGVVVGRSAVVRNPILDKNVEVPNDTRIGVDDEADRQRFTVSDNGIDVVGKDQKIPTTSTTGAWQCPTTSRSTSSG